MFEMNLLSLIIFAYFWPCNEDEDRIYYSFGLGNENFGISFSLLSHLKWWLQCWVKGESIFKLELSSSRYLFSFSCFALKRSFLISKSGEDQWEAAHGFAKGVLRPDEILLTLGDFLKLAYLLLAAFSMNFKSSNKVFLLFIGTCSLEGYPRSDTILKDLSIKGKCSFPQLWSLGWFESCLCTRISFEEIALECEMYSDISSSLTS